MQADHELARSEMEREAKRAAKTEQKVNILIGGLQQRDTAARAKVTELVEQLQSAQIELTCFKVIGLAHRTSFKSQHPDKTQILTDSEDLLVPRLFQCISGKSVQDLGCIFLQALKERELRAAPERIEKATELVQQQREREAELQVSCRHRL